MQFTCQIKVNDDMEFLYYKQKKQIIVDKMIKVCNYMSFATKWVKWHGFNNSIVTSHSCPLHSHKGKSQNWKCVLVNKVSTILWLGDDNFTYTYFAYITTFRCELFQAIQNDLQKRKKQQHGLE